MKNKKSIIAILIIALVAAGGYFGYSNFFAASAEEVVNEVQTYEVKVTSLSETYSTSGNVSSKVEKEIYAPFASDAFTSAVSVGDVVGPGDILGSFDEANIKLEVMNQEKTVLSLEAEVDALKSNGKTSYSVSLQNSKIAYDDAKSTYESNLNLYNAGALSKSDLDASKDAMDKALNTYNLDSSQYNSYDYDVELELLEKSLEIERLQLEALYEDYESVTLMSEYSGTVTEIYVEDGDSVSEGLAVIKIMDMTQLEVIVDISEYEIADLAVGQQVSISALGDESLTALGEISEIDPNAEVDGTDVVIAVTIDIIKGADNFKPGYSATLDVMIAQSDTAMVVPYDALVSTPKGNIITKVVGEEEVQVMVNTGIESSLMVEIISEEISEGDTVIVYSAIDYSSESGMAGGLMIPGMGGGGGQRPEGAGQKQR